jgi:hypothetical protein
MLDPTKIASSGTEAAHQTALFTWASYQQTRIPELKWLHHIPNGGSRGDNAQTRAITGGQMKAQGVKRGVADVFLPVRRGQWPGLYIEMKKPAEKPKRNGGKGGCSDEQIEFGEFVREQGFGWMVCYSWEEARDAILAYLAVS